eukprot:scaffold2563_cov124-Cylindrotheca_fusiformis.AAC.19
MTLATVQHEIPLERQVRGSGQVKFAGIHTVALPMAHDRHSARVRSTNAPAAMLQLRQSIDETPGSGVVV